MNRRTLLKMFSAPAVTRIPMRAAGVKVNRVVISGAGIIGASIAYHLAQRGVEVTILEKQRPGSGATQNSFAWLNASIKQPRPYYELNLMGMLGWRRLCTEIGGELQIQWGGSVRWAPSGPPVDALRQMVGQYENWSYPISLVDEAEFSRLLPGIAPGPFGAAAFCSMEGATDPMHALGMILKKAQQFGAKIEYPCEVTGLNLGGDRVSGVQTTHGPVEADVLLLASGVDTPRLAKMAEVDVPLRDSPGVLAHTSPQARILDRVVFPPGDTSIKQNPDGRIVAGAGSVVGSIADPGKEAGRKALRNAERFLEKLKGIEVETLTLGYRPLPQDGFPIVGFPERRPNLYIAVLHSGMTMAPIIGQLAAMEILDGVAVDLLMPYRLSRFGQGAPVLGPGQIYPGRN